jgi:O-antigen/teichoic acid export membrane protein
MIKSFFNKGLVRNSLILFFATLFVNITQFLMNLFFARQFGPEGFGNFKTVIYLFTFLPLLIELGTGSTLIRYVASLSSKDKKKTNYLIRWFLKLRIILYVLLSIFIFIFRDYIATYLLKDPSLVFLIIPGMILTATSFILSFDSISIGYQNFKLVSISRILRAILTAIFAAYLSYFGVYYAIIGWSFGVFSVLVYWKFFSKKDFFSKTKKFDIKEIFWNYSLPMYFLNLPATLPSVIVPILSLFFSQLLIGYFSFAFMFYFAGLLIPGTLASVLFPKISELDGLKKHGEAKDTLKKALFIYTFIVILGLIGILFFSEWFISLIAPEYLSALFMFQVIISLVLVSGYITIYNAYLSGLGKLKKIAILVLIQNILLFVVSFGLLYF